MTNRSPNDTCKVGDKGCAPCTTRLMIVVPLLVIVGGYFSYSYFFSPSSQYAPFSMAGTDGVKKSQIAVDNGIITPYSEERLNKLLGKEKFALYFSASWCPKCKATKKSIEENPEKFVGVKLLDIDYDKSDELKKKYEITSQHSFVFFNSDGSIARKSIMPKDDEVTAFFTNSTGVTEPTGATDGKAKFAQTEAIVMAMKPNEMSIVSSLYPDLTLTKSVKRGDPDQLAMMGDEDWMYSAQYDITVVVCKEFNTPAHVFHGKSLSAGETQKVRKMHEDMMKMMEGSGMMMGSGHDMTMESHDMEMKTESSGIVPKSENVSKKLTGYIDYEANTLKEALASGQKVALFFHATWCPTCRAMEKGITSSPIPSDTLIVKVDYDTSDALKKQYGIVAQSTTVVLNADGTTKSKQIGAMSVAEIFN